MTDFQIHNEAVIELCSLQDIWDSIRDNSQTALAQLSDLMVFNAKIFTPMEGNPKAWMGASLDPVLKQDEYVSLVHNNFFASWQEASDILSWTTLKEQDLNIAARWDWTLGMLGAILNMTDMFDGGLPHVRPLRNSIINGLQRTYATIMDDFDELGGESADGFISNRVQAFELLGNFMAERPEFQSFGADAHQSNVFYFSQNACAADIIIQAHMVGEMHAGPERTHAMYRLQQLVNYTEEKHGLFKTDEMIVAMDTVEAVATRVKSEEKMIATWNRVKSALKPW